MEGRGSHVNTRWPRRGEGNMPCRRLLSQEKMCVFIFVCTIYGPAGLFREAGPVLALPEELLLGRDTGGRETLPGHNVVMVIGRKFPNGVGWPSPEDLEGTTPWSSQSSRLT